MKYRFAYAALMLGMTHAWSDTLPGSLPNAVEMAILQNPEVLMRYHTLEASTEEQSAAKGAWLPRVSIEANTGRLRSESPILKPHSYSSSGASVQLRQMLFDGFATLNDVRRLSHTRQARYYELLSVTDDTALEASRAYIDVVRYRELVELARLNYAKHAEIHAQLVQRVSAGVGRRVDLEQAAGRMALAESNWLTEQSNLHDVSARFQRLTGSYPAPQLAALPDLDANLPGRHAFLTDTIRQNPSFKAAVASVRASRADLETRKANRWPTLSLQAAEERDRNRNGLAGDYKDRSVQLVLSYNLFNGGSDRARERQYAQQFNAAQDMRDKVCRDLRQLAQIAWNDVERLEEQIRLQSQHELSTAKARDAYRQQFDIGQRSLLDLLDTENELFEARRALASTNKDLVYAKARVLGYSSRLLPTLNLRPITTLTDEDIGGSEESDAQLRCAAELPPAAPLDKQNLPITLPAPIDPPPAAVPATPAAPAAPVTINLAAGTLFDTGKSLLKAEGRTTLDKLVAELQGKSFSLIDIHAKVIGHTDRTGNEAANQRLSLARAKVTAAYLISRGLPASQISTMGMGSGAATVKSEDCAAVAQDKEKLRACHAPDRRVEIRISAANAKVAR